MSVGQEIARRFAEMMLYWRERARQEQQRFLNIGRQVEQVHDLRDPRSGHAAEARQVRIVPQVTPPDQSLEPDRQGRQSRYARYIPRLDIPVLIRVAAAVVSAVSGLKREGHFQGSGSGPGCIEMRDRSSHDLLSVETRLPAQRLDAGWAKGDGHRLVERVGKGIEVRLQGDTCRRTFRNVETGRPDATGLLNKADGKNRESENPEEISLLKRTQPPRLRSNTGGALRNREPAERGGGGPSVCEYGRNDKTPKGCPTGSCVNGRPPKLADGNMAPHLILSPELFSVRQW